MTQLTIDLPVSISHEEARLLLAIKFYEVGKLSLGKAAKLGGYSKSTFIELTSKIGVPVANYSVEEIDQKMAL